MVNLQDALTREHQDIDAGIEAFVADLARGTTNPEPLLDAFEALRRHIYLEEEFLFPPIRQAGLVMPILVMVREHGTLWQLMDALTELLVENDPADIPDVLEPTCRELLASLDHHNSKEEPIVYPHAETDLTDDAAAELADFLQTGIMPDGWACEAAR